MQLIDTLLKKYWTSTITQAEFTVLKDMLIEKKHDDFTNDDDIALLQHDALPVMHNANKNLQLIHEKIDRLENDSKIKKAKISYIHSAIRWVAAAAVVFFFLQYLPVNPHSEKENITPVVAAIVKDSAQVISNTTKLIKHLHLSDGSKVKLYPQSRLVVSSEFNKNGRDIVLYGQAYFTVAKNANKPFSVQANKIVTTALGTQFLVDGRKENSKVIVKLFEGKVVIHHFEKTNTMQPVYLMPGQSCSIDLIKMSTQTTSIIAPPFTKHSAPKEALPISKVTADSSSLIFNRTPLKDVFVSMEKNYNIVIDYNDVKDIEQASFTGKFSLSTSATTLLTIVCATNDLLFESKENIYYIHKK